MKISFESRAEIEQLCEFLQSIYPADIVITLDDLIEARDREDIDDIPLPWNFDGYHPQMSIVIEDDPVNKKANKKVNKDRADKQVNNRPHQTKMVWVHLAEQLGCCAERMWIPCERRYGLFIRVPD